MNPELYEDVLNMLSYMEQHGMNESVQERMPALFTRMASALGVEY